jgi:hypothetical protein
MESKECDFKYCGKRTRLEHTFVFSESCSDWFFTGNENEDERKITKSYCEEHQRYFILIGESFRNSFQKDEVLFNFYARKFGLADEECSLCEGHWVILYKYGDNKRKICIKCYNNLNGHYSTLKKTQKNIKKAVSEDDETLIGKYEEKLDEVCKTIYEITKKIN